MPNYTLTEPASGLNEDGTPKTFGTIPEDTMLDAVVTNIEEVVENFKDKVTGENVIRLEWTFATNFADQDRKVWGKTGTKFAYHPECKFYAWTLETLGVDELPLDFNLDTDNLYGMKCRVTMGVREYTDKNGHPKAVNFVKDVLRSREAMRQAPASAPAPKVVEDEEPF